MDGMLHSSLYEVMRQSRFVHEYFRFHGEIAFQEIVNWIFPVTVLLLRKTLLLEKIEEGIHLMFSVHT